MRLAPSAKAFLAGLCILPTLLVAADAPRLERKDGRFALVVDGKPFLILGAQINNSSAWPNSLPRVWPALEAMHVNTVEAPVYWEQMEPEPGKFDFSNVDELLAGARQHHLRLVLLWFGTWKNGQAHYIPEWMKNDTKRYPRALSARGKVLPVLSASSASNLEADKHAFSALMRHLREADATQRTVIMVQVENESGSIGTVRDYSPAAQKEFAGAVPATLTSALRVGNGNWSQVFGPDADENFMAYSVAHYISEVARAGKAEYPLPMYCNVWIKYPVHALEDRDRAVPGQEYPSGGPQQDNIDIWKAAAPVIDLLAPDFYSDDMRFYHEIIAAYHRDDNAFFIPETGMQNNFGRYFFLALGHGAIGFSPFGVDYTGWTISDEKIPGWLSEDFALFEPIAGQVAQLNFDGKLQTAVEEKGSERQRLHFGDVDAMVSFGFPQRDGEMPPGNPDSHGRAMVAQLGPLEYLVTGFDASVSFQLADNPASKAQNQQLEILRAEEGGYVKGSWQALRTWNGDQTDRGLNFKSARPEVVRIRLHTIELYDRSAARPGKD
jgi:hypothetical protein